MRIAIVSTPRSGNTWLRLLLSEVCGLTQLAVHYERDDDIDWRELPDRVVLQLHWYRAEPLISQLAGNGFQVVTIARHPLDVLLSILHYGPREAQTASWLGGDGGNELPLVGASPRSPGFQYYARSARARKLLSITPGWWHHPGVVRVRYEDMVEGPAASLARALDDLGAEPVTDVHEAVEHYRLEHLRPTAPQNSHFWLGRPGLWRHVLLAHEAREIARCHPASMAPLGYTCDGDLGLSPEAADDYWRSVA